MFDLLRDICLNRNTKVGTNVHIRHMMKVLFPHLHSVGPSQERRHKQTTVADGHPEFRIQQIVHHKTGQML